MLALHATLALLVSAGTLAWQGMAGSVAFEMIHVHDAEKGCLHKRAQHAHGRTFCFSAFQYLARFYEEAFKVGARELWATRYHKISHEVFTKP